MSSHAVPLLLAMRLCLAAVFAYAAIGKIMNLPEFTRGVVDYALLPPRLSAAIARFVPWLELGVAVALIAGVATPMATALAAVMLAVFIGAVTVNLHRGRLIPCHCHGLAGTETIGWGTVARNGLLVLMALGVFAGGLAEHTSWIDLSSTFALILRSPSRAVMTATLLGFCLLEVYIIEWTVDVHLRSSRVRSIQLSRERSP